MQLPKEFPEMGYYYHYKHDPKGTVNNYAYEVLGVGFHTEEAPLGEQHFVIYRPLYEAFVYKASKTLGIPCFDNRPLIMWMGDVVKGGVTKKRFTKILDPKLISLFDEIKKEMYE